MTERLRIDALSAIRSLRQAPATVASAVLTLAVAVGLNLAMFGLIDRALLSPPAHVADPDRVFTLGFEVPGTNGAPGWMTTTSYVTFDAIREHVAVATDSAAWQRLATSVVVDDTQMSADAMLVSGSYFSLLGARPLLGRAILPEDDRPPAGSAVAVVSHAFWKSTLGGDRAVIGRRVSVRGVEFTISGVMPAGFSGHAAVRVDVWVPFHAAMRGSPGWDHDRFRNIAGIVMRVPRADSQAVAAAQASSAIERKVSLFPIVGADIASAERRIAYWLTGVSILVLVLGLANTSTLLLVRGAGRRRDLAIRPALGATRGRLVSQVSIEAALLATAAVATALLLSYWLDEAVRRVLLPSVVQSAGHAGMRTFGVAALAGIAAFIAAAAAGIAQLPARYHWLGDDLAGASRGRPRRRAYAALLLVQTTLSVLLLAGAGMIQRLVVGSRTDLPFLHVRRYSDLLEGQMRPWRLGTMLLALFGALALSVAAVGLYAAFAHSVAERRREMAIRIAIGARSRVVLLMILTEAARVAASGVICGCILAAIGGRWVQSMLFGTAPSDPLVLGSAAVTMLIVAALATLVPARRAARANPGTLLRAE